jgi:replicative DNA helicase
LLHYPHKYGIKVTDRSYVQNFGFDVTNYRDKKGDVLKNENYFNLIIAKARSGRTGNIHLKYIPQFHRIEEIYSTTNKY